MCLRQVGLSALAVQLALFPDSAPDQQQVPKAADPAALPKIALTDDIFSIRKVSSLHRTGQMCVPARLEGCRAQAWLQLPVGMSCRQRRSLKHLCSAAPPHDAPVTRSCCGDLSAS